MKKNIIILIVALLSINGFSQTVSYKITKNDPTDFHRLLFTSSVTLDMWGEEMAVGYDFRTRLLLTKRIIIDANYYSGIKNRDSEQSDPIFKYNNLVPYGWEIVGQFGFSSNIRRKDLEVKMYENAHIDVEGKRIRDWTIRGGFMSHNSKGEISRDITMTGFAFGIGHIRWSNLQIYAQGYGKKYASAMVSYYFDIIYATSIISNDSISLPVSSNNIGYRFGFEFYTNISRNISLMMRADYGNRPGVEDDEFNLTWTTGITILLF